VEITGGGLRLPGRSSDNFGHGPLGCARVARYPAGITRVLFLCSRNRARSPTAEQIFSGRPGLEVASAGLSPGAEAVCSADLIEWAEIIFVIERSQRAKLTRQFGAVLGERKVIRLDTPYKFNFMSPALISLL